MENEVVEATTEVVVNSSRAWKLGVAVGLAAAGVAVGAYLYKKKTKDGADNVVELYPSDEEGEGGTEEPEGDGEELGESSEAESDDAPSKFESTPLGRRIDRDTLKRISKKYALETDEEEDDPEFDPNKNEYWQVRDYPDGYAFISKVSYDSIAEKDYKTDLVIYLTESSATIGGKPVTYDDVDDAIGTFAHNYILDESIEALHEEVFGVPANVVYIKNARTGMAYRVYTTFESLDNDGDDLS